MAYNKAKEEYKWKVWKEQEEKKLRELGVSEEVIAELRDYDWNCFKQERNYKNHQMPDTDFIERTEDASGKWEIQQPVRLIFFCCWISYLSSHFPDIKWAHYSWMSGKTSTQIFQTSY